VLELIAIRYCRVDLLFILQSMVFLSFAFLEPLYRMAENIGGRKLWRIHSSNQLADKTLANSQFKSIGG